MGAYFLGKCLIPFRAAFGCLWAAALGGRVKAKSSPACHAMVTAGGKASCVSVLVDQE